MRAAATARSACSTASTSTTRCACTAVSASRSARSTPCSGARSTSTPSGASPKLLHDKQKLGEWMETVPEPEPLEIGAERRRSSGDRAERRVLDPRGRDGLAAIGVVRSQNVVHAALYLVVVLAGAAAQYILLGRRVRGVGAGAHLHRRHRRSCSCSGSCSPGADAQRGDLDNDQRLAVGGGVAVPLRRAHGPVRRRLRRQGDQARRRAPPSAAPSRRLRHLPHYLVPFEVVSMLLLAALVGAVVIARRD